MKGWSIAALVTLVVVASVSLAASARAAATPLAYYALLLPYAALAAFALYRMKRAETLRAAFRCRWGDVSVGAFVAALLVAGCWAARAAIAPPGSPADVWVARIYLQMGEVPMGHGALVQLSTLVVVIALLDELVWRGLVQPSLAEHLGARRGWLVTTALYGLAHVPTVWLLMGPAGPNPLVVMTALYCGCVWGFLAGRLGRLSPSLLAHAFFAYAITTQFRLWSLRLYGARGCAGGDARAFDPSPVDPSLSERYAMRACGAQGPRDAEENVRR